jgi:hypothetical protein
MAFGTPVAHGRPGTATSLPPAATAPGAVGVFKTRAGKLPRAAGAPAPARVSPALRISTSTQPAREGGAMHGTR